MRRLLPSPADDVDLADAYAYPEGRWLRANMVATADGAVAFDGRSGPLSGPGDRRVFSVLRGLADVVVAGGRTVRIEGYGPERPRPQTAAARRDRGQAPAPVMAVVSNSLAFDPAAPLFTEPVVPTVVLTSERAPADRRAALEQVTEVVVAGESRVDLRLAVDALAERGLPRMLCEGGPTLLAETAAAGCLDELCLTVNPSLTAGHAPRVLSGVLLPEPARLRVGHLLEDDGWLFLRYVVERPNALPGQPEISTAASRTLR